jgi:hypothetical protein
MSLEIVTRQYHTTISPNIPVESRREEYNRSFCNYVKDYLRRGFVPTGNVVIEEKLTGDELILRYTITLFGALDK